MEISFGKIQSESPFEEAPPEFKKTKAYSGDYWGAFSLEKFASAGALTYTHEDVGGWLAYLQKFHPRNFWYKDSNVRIWAYYEQYDNWQDTYGLDAVLAAYHSGHGGMDASGKFYAPLGADWGGLGTTACSHNMRLGNEQVNYIFWSTCLSCRVLGGQNPIKTWSPANLGFRMLFGYETVSIDSPNYGKYFWQEWKKGKSFSTAFLDASWRIYHGQAPAVVACGKDKEEAKNRVFNERKFSWPHVKTNWWWWRWYYAASAATTVRTPNVALPKKLLVAELEPVDINEQYIRDVIGRFGLEEKLPIKIIAAPGDVFYQKNENVGLAFADDGSYEVQLAQPNISNTEQIPLEKAKSIATEAIKRYGLDKNVDLIFDCVRLSSEGGGSSEATGQLEGPFVTESTVQFRQVINDLPVLTPEAGTVRVSVDNDGSITAIHSLTRPIDRLVDRPKNTTSTPEEKEAIAKPKATDVTEYEQLLTAEWQKLLAGWVTRGSVPTQYTVVPDSTEIGYDIRGNEAVLVARRVIEVELGNGYRKLYFVEAPILE